jgi:hypothetical protein
MWYSCSCFCSNNFVKFALVAVESRGSSGCDRYRRHGSGSTDAALRLAPATRDTVNALEAISLASRTARLFLTALNFSLVAIIAGRAILDDAAKGLLGRSYGGGR